LPRPRGVEKPEQLLLGVLSANKMFWSSGPIVIPRFAVFHLYDLATEVGFGVGPDPLFRFSQGQFFWGCALFDSMRGRAGVEP
jgi:hypothetical protein